MNDQSNAPRTAMDVAPLEERIAAKLDLDVAGRLGVSERAGGIAFANAGQAMEFAKMMAISGVAVPKHLRGAVGACLAVVIQAIEWRLSPYAVANKSYSVNDRLAYESQLIQAVILQRAPIKGRFKVEFTGAGEARVCRVWAELRDDGEIVEYVSPPFGRITPKNSPLWKSDPDQQHFYYSGRALCRRHFPDVLLGVYARDEIEDERDPEGARDITPPPRSLSSKLDMLAGGGEIVTSDGEVIDGPPELAREPTTDAAPKPKRGAKAKATPEPQDDPAPATADAEPPPAEERHPLTEAAVPVAETAPRPPAAEAPSLALAEKKQLREFNTALVNAMTPTRLQKVSSDFWPDPPEEGTALGAAVDAIFSAHVRRVSGDGSPAECDDLTARLTK